MVGAELGGGGASFLEGGVMMMVMMMAWWIGDDLFESSFPVDGGTHGCDGHDE